MSLVSKILPSYLNERFRPFRGCYFVLSSQFIQVLPCVLPRALSATKCQAQRADMKNIVLLLYLFSAGQSFQGTSNFCWDFRSQILYVFRTDVGCFLFFNMLLLKFRCLSGTWALLKILPSTKLLKEKTTTLYWYRCVCGSIMNQVWTGWKKQGWTWEPQGQCKPIEVARPPNMKPQPSRLLMSRA